MLRPPFSVLKFINLKTMIMIIDTIHVQYTCVINILIITLTHSKMQGNFKYRYVLTTTKICVYQTNKYRYTNIVFAYERHQYMLVHKTKQQNNFSSQSRKCLFRFIFCYNEGIPCVGLLKPISGKLVVFPCLQDFLFRSHDKRSYTNDK